MTTAAQKCPFRATIMTRSFACQYAEEITRREGPDIACNSTSANNACVDFFSQLKVSALSELGYEDDLTTMPASVLQKIQYGGLLGLNNTVNDGGSDVVNNIYELIDAAMQQYGDIKNFPYAECIAAIKDYKMKRRRNR